MRLCNKREPTTTERIGLVRCQKKVDAKGKHRGYHWAIDAQGNEYAWGPGYSDAKPPPKANSALAEQTIEHELSEAFTNGVKATAITYQLLEHGKVTCISCGICLLDATWNQPPSGTDEYEDWMAAAVEKAMSLADKHHVNGRVGHGYRPGKHGNDFGFDLPLLIETPICRPCHTGLQSEIHPGPQWSRQLGMGALQ